VRGAGQGRLLGFPTANLALAPELLVPAEGIYAAWALFDVDGRTSTHPGALYIGRKPTFGGARLSVEVFLLTTRAEALELYGKELEVRLVARLR